MEEEADRVLLPLDHEKAADLKFLEACNATLLATEVCRHHFLGISDAVTSRFKLSPKQIETLEEIGKSREKGCLQADLARTLGVVHKNFFFVMKQLEGRGLAVRNPLVLERSPNSNYSSSSTNIIHLPIYAPKKLKQFQVFKLAKDSGQEDDEDQELSKYSIRDDASWMRQIFSRLVDSPDKLALEFNIKQSLEIRGTRGHRMWRRLKKKMVESGLIKSFVAEVDQKPAVCLQLLYDDFDDWLLTQRKEEMKNRMQGPESCLLAEAPINRQIYNMIVDAGPQGINSRDLFEKLRLNNKRNIHRLRQLQEMCGISMHGESVGKNCISRCYAPLDVIKKRMAGGRSCAGGVVAPAGGWKLAVKRAAMIGSELMDQSRSVTLIGEALEAGSSSDDESQKRVRSLLFSHLVSTKFEFRSKHLLEKINREGFAIRSQIGAYIRDQEISHGMSDGPAADRKTLSRVINRLIDEGKIKKIKVSTMTKTSSESKVTEVLIGRDQEVTEELVDRIRQSTEVFAVTCRQKNRSEMQFINQRSEGELLPVINTLTKQPRISPKRRSFADASGEGSAFQQIHMNGFIVARMSRARILHYHICRLVGLGGHESLLASDQSRGAHLPRVLDRCNYDHFDDTRSDKSEVFRFVSVTRGQKEVSRSESGDIDGGYFPRTFTPRQLWDFLPASVYLQVVGTSNKSGEIFKLFESDSKMKDLPEDKLELLVDRLSKNRLADILDLLCRMRLIDKCVSASEAEIDLLKSSRFLVHPVGVIEVPMEQSPEQVVPRQVQCSLETKEGLEIYWLRLEFTFLQKRSLIKSCFPATVAAEVCYPCNWAGSKTIPTAKWLTLQSMVAELEPMDWQKCKQVADDLGLSYHQVVKHCRDRATKSLPKSSTRKRSSRSTIRPKGKAIASDRAKKATRPRKKPRKPFFDVNSILESGLDELPAEEADQIRKIREEEAKVAKSGYWNHDEDVRLLSGYFAWLSSSKPTKSGPRWTAMIGLPGGSSTSSLQRVPLTTPVLCFKYWQCKRRMRYLMKQKQLKSLFSKLKETTSQLYSSRESRLERLIKAEEVQGESKPKKSPGMEIYQLNPFSVMTRHRGMNLLDVMIETCDEEDKALIMEMKQLVEEIATQGPRTARRESETVKSPSSAVKLKPVPELVDLSSSVVKAEGKTKRVGFRVWPRSLSSLSGPITLNVAVAKDLIVSSLYSAESRKYLSQEASREIVGRFQDEDIYRALCLLYEEGWISGGTMRSPICMSRKFVKRMEGCWLSEEVFEEARREYGMLEETEDVFEGVASREYTAEMLTTGTTLFLLSAVTQNAATICCDGLDSLKDPETCAAEEIYVKVSPAAEGRSRKEKMGRKQQGMRRTFSQLLVESELDLQQSKVQKTQHKAVCNVQGDLSPEQSAICEVVRGAGQRGLGLGEICDLLPTDIERVEVILKELCAVREIRSLRGPGGTLYLSRDHSDHLVYPASGDLSEELEIRPWRSHGGATQRDFLAKIQRLALSTVIECPGILEEDLVECLGFCSRHSAKELLSDLVDKSLLRTQEIQVTEDPSPVSIFLSASPQTATKVAYFADIVTCLTTPLAPLD